MSPRAYTVTDVCAAMKISRRSFFDLRKRGELPMLEELQPRIGRRMRFRAEPIDRWLSGQFGQPRSFASHRRLAS